MTKSKGWTVGLVSFFAVLAVFIAAATSLFLGGAQADTERTESEKPSGIIYESDFSDSEDRLDELPEHWVRGAALNGGLVYQQNGALFLDCMKQDGSGKGIGGLHAVYFNGMTSCDYAMEADLTMVRKTENGRWIGLAYRAPTALSPKSYVEMIHMTASNIIRLKGWYGSDEWTGQSSWNEARQIELTANTVKTRFPNLTGKLTAGNSVRFRLFAVGNEVIAYLDEYEVVRRTIPETEGHLLDGKLGFVTNDATMKIENVKVTSLAELTRGGGTESIDHGITFPTTETASVQLSENNYTSVTVANLTESENRATVTLAQSDEAQFSAYADKSGNVGIVKTVEGVETELLTSTVTVADPSAVAIKATVANGYARLWIDGVLVGSAFIGDAQSVYGVTAADGVVYTSGAVNKTDKTLERTSVGSDMQPIDYGTKSPDWSGLNIAGLYSDGSVKRVAVTDGMVFGYDPYESGEQRIKVLYELEGENRVSEFDVTVKENPAPIGLKVGIMSDTHIGGTASNKTAMQKALLYYKTMGVDLIVVTGDIAHNNYRYLAEFQETFDSVYTSTDIIPEKIYVMGNHDMYCIEEKGYRRGSEAHNSEIEKVFDETFGVTADYGRPGINYYEVVKGYVFVGLYVQTPMTERAAMIAKAYELPEAQGKPVFIVQHEQPIGALYNATATNSGDAHDFEIDGVLKNYPNAIMLAGHAHNPLADERAIWQGGYTVVTCGSLSGSIVEPIYEGGTLNGKIQPNQGSAKSALYMEVSDNSANIVRYDFTHDKKLGNNWVIPFDENGTVDRTPYNYELRKAAATAPEFAPDAVATAEPIAASIVRISFPKAVTVYPHSDDIIQSYIIRAFNDDTNELCGEKRVITQHYLGRDLDNDSYSLRFNGLRPDIDYRFEIVAVESYQKEGAPLIVRSSTKEFYTGDKVADYHGDFDLPWEKDFFDSYLHIPTVPVLFTNGSIVTDAQSSSKAILKNFSFVDGTVETRVTMLKSGGILDGGLYLFASDADNERDMITALNVELESAVGSRDLKVSVFRFTGKYDGPLGYITLRDYFADGAEKDGVTLKVEVTSGLMSIFVDGKLALTYDAGSTAKLGSVGIRAHYSSLAFDYLKIYSSDGEYTAPETAELDELLAEATELLTAYRVGTASTVTCGQSFVTESMHTSLQAVVMACESELAKMYSSNVDAATETLRQRMSVYRNSVSVGKKHACNDWTVTKAAACTAAGERAGSCTICDEQVTEVTEKIAHSYGDELTHDATCIHGGYTYHICTECGQEEWLGGIAAKGHTAGEWELDIAQGATTGERHKSCTVCGEILETESVYVVNVPVKDTDTDTQVKPTDNGMTGGTIAAIVIAVVEGAAIVAAAAVFLVKKKRSSK